MQGTDWLGLVRQVRWGEAGRGVVRHGTAGFGRSGLAGQGEVSYGAAG